MTRKEKSESLPPITISFGDVFLSQGTKKRYIILDIGEESWCEAAQIITVQHEDAISIPGTTERENISQVIDHWDLEKILLAATRYYGDTTPIGGVYDGIRTNAHQVPRQLK